MENFRPSDPGAGAGGLGKEEGGLGADGLGAPGPVPPSSQHISSSLCFFDASCLFKGYPPSCEAARVECSASSLQITDAARWAEGTASPVRACSGRACSTCYANTVCAHVAVRGPGSDPNIRCKW